MAGGVRSSESSEHGCTTGIADRNHAGEGEASAVFGSQTGRFRPLSVPLPGSTPVSRLVAPGKAGDYDGFHGGHQGIAHEVCYVSCEAAVRGKTRQLVGADLAMAYPMVSGVGPLPKGSAMRNGGPRLLKNPRSTCLCSYPCL